MSVESPLNPVYAQSLDRMADYLLPTLRGPIVDSELSVLEKPLFVTQATQLPAMRAGISAGAPEKTVHSVPRDELELLQGIAAPTLTHKRYKLPKVVASWENLDPAIRPQIVRTPNIVAFSTRKERNMDRFGNTEAFALYDTERAIALASVMRIMFSRLDSLEERCARGFESDPVTMLYKRVAKPAQGRESSVRRTVDVPTEGIVSIVQAISQIESDFRTRGLEPLNNKALSRAILSYTAAVTYGYFGEMSLRGMRFGNMFDTKGAMTNRYHGFFTYLQVTQDPNKHSFVAANAGEGCPAAKRARKAAKAIVSRFTDVFFDVENEVNTCFDTGRAQKPKLRAISLATGKLASYNTERDDIDLCLRTPALSLPLSKVQA